MGFCKHQRVKHSQHTMAQVNILVPKGTNKGIKKIGCKARPKPTQVNHEACSFMSSTWGKIWQDTNSKMLRQVCPGAFLVFVALMTSILGCWFCSIRLPSDIPLFNFLGPHCNVGFTLTVSHTALSVVHSLTS